MITYIKLNPPSENAIEALERLAIGMHNVCIMNTRIEKLISPYLDFGQIGNPDRAQDFDMFQFTTDTFDYLEEDIPENRCNTLISKSGSKMGDFDFYFEWNKNPTKEQLEDLKKKIGEVLKPIKVQYSVVDK